MRYLIPTSFVFQGEGHLLWTVTQVVLGMGNKLNRLLESVVVNIVAVSVAAYFSWILTRRNDIMLFIL